MSGNPKMEPAKQPDSFPFASSILHKLRPPATEGGGSPESTDHAEPAGGSTDAPAVPDSLRAVVDKPETRAHLETPAVMQRLEKLAEACPLYANAIDSYPYYYAWLEIPHNRDEGYRWSAFQTEWRELLRDAGANDSGFDARNGQSGEPLKEEPALTTGQLRERLNLLRRFRRKMCLRMAYREINEFCPVDQTIGELSLLAEFCLQQVYMMAYAGSRHKYGTPWDEQLDRPARFCILALGKFGGKELNFCSDIDLIYIYEGEGHCRKNDKATQLSNEQFFSRMGRDIGNWTQERTNDGFLYNVDFRLRPEGKTGPLVRSLTSLESYYSTAGQTWERLALIKTRPVAGDINLGHELFETLNTFRYPRHPPPSLLSEVAGVKIRMEKEIVGSAKLERDIKRGTGGIREVEFYVQSLQLLYGGRNPFLQNESTLEALERLYRYNLAGADDKLTLREAYLFFRLVENRLQMRDERQTHTLPEKGPERRTLARSLGFDSEEAFEARLTRYRTRVKAIYDRLFQESGREAEIQEWSLFFSGKPPGEGIRGKLEAWFGRSTEEACERLRRWVVGAPHNMLTREHVTHFLEISATFDTVLPPLARPLRTLERVEQFTAKYGARAQFLKLCSHNPEFFRGLTLLLDRSEFIFKLLCQHPEILEEIFYAGLRLRKDRRVVREELNSLPHESDADLARLLWLYVKAEQVRIAIAELLAELAAEEVENALTMLAEETLRRVMEICDPEGHLALVGLGKFGSGETAFGSDLDLIAFGRENTPESIRIVRRLQKVCGHRGPMGRTYEVDFRLRPHGKDGPLIVTPEAFRQYHQSTAAQTWERQILIRSRWILGNREMGEAFHRLRNELVYPGPLDKEALTGIWHMRQRIEKEKAAMQPPQLAFKAGPGGLIDIEFIAQTLQMHFGREHPEIREPSTRKTIAALGEAGILDSAGTAALLENYNFLRKLELYLRRQVNDAVTTLEKDDEGERKRIPKWLGYSDYETFWNEHMRRMAETRERVRDILATKLDFDWSE